MKFICSKQDLQKSINTVIRATYNKMQKSILECIHLQAEEGRLVLDAFDTVTAIQTSMFAEVEQHGAAAIPARLLAEVVGKMPDGEITFERDEGVCISCRSSRVRLQEMDENQFPAFPNMEAQPFALSAQDLKLLVDGTAFAVYQFDDKPIFTGLLFEADADELSVVAIDGVRMARRTARTALGRSLRVVIPAKAMREAAKLVGEKDASLRMAFDDKACFLLTDDTTIYTRLLEGEFMNYQNILPQGYATRVRVQTRLFEESLQRVSVLAREDSSNLVRMQVDGNLMKLSANSEYGAATDELPVLTEGEVVSIAFNAKYLLDVCKAVDDDELLLEFNGRLKPCLFKPVEGEEYLYLVVPVNVRE